MSIPSLLKRIVCLAGADGPNPGGGLRPGSVSHAASRTSADLYSEQLPLAPVVRAVARGPLGAPRDGHTSGAERSHLIFRGCSAWLRGRMAVMRCAASASSSCGPTSQCGTQGRAKGRSGCRGLGWRAQDFRPGTFSGLWCGGYAFRSRVWHGFSQVLVPVPCLYSPHRVGSCAQARCNTTM